MKCPKSGIFTNNIGRSESGKVILQVSIAVFSGAVEIFFSGKDGSAPEEKLAGTPMRIRSYFYNEMRYINLRFTYLVTYLLTMLQSVLWAFA